MKKLIVALALIPALAFGTTTWSDTAQGVKAVCTTGTEAAPTLATEGLPLAAPGLFTTPVKGFAIHIETGGTMTAGGILQAYLWNPVSGQWNRTPELDLFVLALAAQSFSGFQVVSPAGRIAYVPSGVGVASTIFIVPTY